MAAEETAKIGKFVWQDLTVEDATAVRDFYRAVVGWTAKDHDMGGYADYEMYPAGSDECVGGICHARGTNENLPAQWLLYVQVTDVAASAAKCVELGGKVLEGPRAMGAQQFCVIQDPAGAVMALIG